MTAEQHLRTPGENTRDDWKNTILAGLANYIDAGSIVAGAAALALWTAMFHLGDTFVGLIGAFSSNAISAGVGALIGGRLCDKLGRKKIYQWDMLIYAAGMLLLIFAVKPWMIVAGFLVVGLAVGADIPASWTIIAEMAPTGHRGKHSGVAQMLRYLGPAVVLLASLALSGLGVLGARIIFAHLVVVALALWALRLKMRESTVWTTAKAVAVEHDPNAPKIAEPEVGAASTRACGHGSTGAGPGATPTAPGPATGTGGGPGRPGRLPGTVRPAPRGLVGGARRPAGAGRHPAAGPSGRPSGGDPALRTSPVGAHASVSAG